MSTTMRKITVHPTIDGKRHKLIVNYGIRNPDQQDPYFTVTGELYEPVPGGRYRSEPTIGGTIHDVISDYLPWLDQLIEVHLDNAITGEPLHAEANAWFWYANEGGRGRGRGRNNEMNLPLPPAFAHQDAIGRAATYLGCDPSVFNAIAGYDKPCQRAQFSAVIDTLRPLWTQRAVLIRNMYRLELPTDAGDPPLAQGGLDLLFVCPDPEHNLSVQTDLTELLSAGTPICTEDNCPGFDEELDFQGWRFS